MPNHCSQDFRVYGRAADLDRFVARHIRSNTLDCTSVIPYPDKYLLPDLIKHRYEALKLVKQAWACPDGFNRGGYDWCCTNWGTKWGTYNGHCLSTVSGHRSYRFDSAWGPPTPVFFAVAKQWPQLTFKIRYFEAGMGFAGYMMFEHGECTLDERRNNYRGSRGG